MSARSTNQRVPRSLATQPRRSFVARGIPLVGIAIGVVGCDEGTPNPYTNVSGDTGPARDTGGADTSRDLDVGIESDTGGSVDTGILADTGGTTDTGGPTDTGGSGDTGGSTDTGGATDTDGPDALSDEVVALIARFCAASADCGGAGYSYSAEACETYLAEDLPEYAEYGADCYAAKLAYLDALSRGTCVIEEYDGYEYAELRSNDVDLVGFAVACTDATPEEIAVATAFCGNYVSCYTAPDVQADECVAEVLWYLGDGYADDLAYFECLAEAECIDGYLDYDACYEGY